MLLSRLSSMFLPKAKPISQVIGIYLAARYSILSNTVKAQSKLTKYYKDTQYDLAVIGGGSAGLATAFQAHKYGLKVIVIDYVEPSLRGTKWGLGGTCVNVGCIPKKLMHQAAKLGESIVDAGDYGWVLPYGLNRRGVLGTDAQLDDDSHTDSQIQNTNLSGSLTNTDIIKNPVKLHNFFQWQKLTSSIINHIRSLNFGYVAQTNRQAKVDYLNSLASFRDKNTLVCSKSPAAIRSYVENDVEPQDAVQVRAKNILVATGTRPTYLPCEGAQLAITSDDIFFKKTPPGRTLVVGGGYVALEVAGFLNGLGYPVSVTTRGEYLRAFDRDMVAEIVQDLKDRGVQMIPTSLPTKLIEANKSLSVQLQCQKTKNITEKQFDTVLFAVGRSATTNLLNLKKIGVQIEPNTHKIITLKDQVQRTNTENIYALGDVVYGLPELTSTAVKMGHSLARRIAQRLGKATFSKNQTQISLHNFPTTVFTPLEYSVAGLSEQAAKEQYGSDAISVYHVKYMGLEENLLQKYTSDGTSRKKTVYAKAIVHKQSDKILGLHFAGPHAGEVLQGFAVAMRMGLTKAVLDSTIGIHPTVAEELTGMNITKQSGQPFEKHAC